MSFFGRKRTSVGLDIGTGCIKLAEVDQGGDRPELLQAVARPMPAGAVVDGEIARPDLVAAAVRTLLDDTDLGSRSVITALGGHDVFVKRLKVARKQGADPDDQVRREAERHIPFDVRSVHLDFHILDPHGNDPQMDVLLAAAKKDRVDARISLLADAGASVSLLDVEPLALCNSLSHNHPSACEGVVGLVNLGHESTNIIILVDGSPVLIRDLPLGLKRFGELLQRVHGLPVEWAEEVIQGRRALEGFDRAVETGADVIAVGIERACAFAGKGRPGEGLGRVFLSGGVACVQGVAEVLGRRMKVETRVANPCERVAVASGARGRSILADASPLFFQSIGLALRAA